MDQSTVGGLCVKVTAWLRVARSEKGNELQHKQAAAELVRSWLARNVPPTPSNPKGLGDGIQEAFTDPADRRKFGYFKPVPQAPKQYYYWTDEVWKDKALMKEKRKGETSFNASPPTMPKYLAMLLDYDRCRKAFLSEGHTTAQGSAEFRDECKMLREKYQKYRADYAVQENNPIDDDAKGWGETFAKAEKIAAELVAEGGKTGVWELLAPGAN